MSLTRPRDITRDIMEVIAYLNKGYTIRDVAKLSGKSVSSVQRVKKEILSS